ncbi:ClpP/crotonase-like domain-containing protein [Glomus cerebriforme]|uniref:ClpP/crotonase-like domain-containing protein n=1 Tax=Glomus cerebriforme TaxID=658196 RepID=A0A397SYG5_9GLOM|nr:ClpP/crotonase-like domain-containing protein [Glomus cerebriforme]
MSIKTAFPDASNQMVTLVREGPLFIMTMKTGENRFTTQFVEALFGALDEIERVREQEDGEPAALITTGEGKFFSNGLDLEHAISTPGFFDDYYLKLLTRILTFPIPTVAAINGHAFAGGFMLALAHDYRVMRNDRGYLCMNEVDLPSPLHPGMAAIVRIKMTPKTYRDCILQAHKFTAKEALEQELVETIVSGGEILEKAKELGLKWSGKAKAGVIYGSLKKEMYIEGVKYLNLQIELKDAVIRSKEDKIAQLQEALIVYKDTLIKSQKDLIAELTKQPTTNERPFNGYNNNGYSCNSEYRVFVGSVKPDMSKTKLRRMLEEQFGRVIHMDLVISKSCAFVTFESFETYDAAIKQGNVYIDGCAYSVQAARAQRRKTR